MSRQPSSRRGRPPDKEGEAEAVCLPTRVRGGGLWRGSLLSRGEPTHPAAAADSERCSRRCSSATVSLWRAFKDCNDDRAKMKYLIVMYPSFDPLFVASVQPLTSLWAALYIQEEHWEEYNPQKHMRISHNGCHDHLIHGVSLAKAWSARGLGAPRNRRERATIEEIQLLGNGRFIPHIEVV